MHRDSATPAVAATREGERLEKLYLSRARGVHLPRRELTPHAPRSRPGSRPASRNKGDRGGDRSGDDGAAKTRRASRSSSSAAQHQQPASFWRASGTRRCEKGTGDDQQGDGGHRKPSLSESSRPPSPTCSLEPFRRAFLKDRRGPSTGRKTNVPFACPRARWTRLVGSRATSFSSRARGPVRRGRGLSSPAPPPARSLLGARRRTPTAPRRAALLL